jgi:N-acetylglucosamine kinase-like BadF-type ATPase
VNLVWTVGIDGGGTKTAVAASHAGEPHTENRAESGPSNIAIVPIEDAVGHIIDAVQSAGVDPNYVSRLCAGVAGYSAVDKRTEFERQVDAAFPNATILVVPDYAVAHAAAFEDGVGVVVIAGTGSIAYGVNTRGETAVCGGYGYLIDDLGTGYGVGRQILLHAGKVFDGSESPRELFTLWKEATGIESREELISAVYRGSLDRSSIAGLAPLVAQGASQGDKAAVSILMHAGGGLARVTQAAATRLFGADETIAVATVGSLWSAGGELTAVFERSLRRSHPKNVLVSPIVTPAVGALRMAQRLLERDA